MCQWGQGCNGNLPPLSCPRHQVRSKWTSGNHMMHPRQAQGNAVSGEGWRQEMHPTALAAADRGKDGPRGTSAGGTE